MKVKKKKEFGNPRNEENKISSNEMNEVFEEDDGQCNESPNSKSEELKYSYHTVRDLQTSLVVWSLL